MRISRDAVDQQCRSVFENGPCKLKITGLKEAPGMRFMRVFTPFHARGMELQAQRRVYWHYIDHARDSRAFTRINHVKTHFKNIRKNMHVFLCALSKVARVLVA
jgi:hypothetical protein